MNKLSYKAQEYPGLTGAVIASLFGLLVSALASYGLNLTPEMETFLTALIQLVFPFVGAWVAQRWSTPLIRPQDNEGNALTPDSFYTP
jgi:hypothetical protein